MTKLAFQWAVQELRLLWDVRWAQRRKRSDKHTPSATREEWREQPDLTATNVQFVVPEGKRQGDEEHQHELPERNTGILQRPVCA